MEPSNQGQQMALEKKWVGNWRQFECTYVPMPCHLTEKLLLPMMTR